jgi:hypothetical protein
MLKIFLLMTVGAFPVFAKCEPLRFEVRCLTHDGKRPVNVKFAMAYVPDGKLSIGYVQYEKSNRSILLSHVGSEVEFLSKGRPATVTSTWKEVFKERFGGEYTVVSQGVNIYRFSYRSAAGKVTSFENNQSAANSDYSDCNWN